MNAHMGNLPHQGEDCSWWHVFDMQMRRRLFELEDTVSEFEGYATFNVKSQVGWRPGRCCNLYGLKGCSTQMMI
jgi:hypothetical protein